ncbi:MAG: M20/M25/M40 family metallo-hydrolase, partial [bacterium]|nr:M20/M25/M40 family metallo-hydrolase [bacterium]
AHIAELSGPDYGGREAGTPGAELAAAYVAAQFAELGLEPVGDWISDTGESNYLQLLPISHTHLSTIPVVTLLDDNGEPLHDLRYREEFLEKGGQGDVEGELVWLSSNSLEGLFFDGTVVVEQYVPMPLARANALASRGASGLVVVTRRDADDLQVSYSSYRPGGTVTVTGPDADDSRLSYSQSTSGGAGSIPVVEITEAAFEALLGRLGTSRQELASAPPVLPLGGRVRQSIARSPVTTTLTANVLGLLPGRDPALAGEVIVVGAHYDHVGQSPDGLHFPGANGNGSGVAVMLELARVWQEARYRPARSVLFVAWGAEEIKSSGAAHYLAHPAIPLTRTVGIIALDSIGAGRGPRLLYTAIEREIPLAWPVEVGAMQLGRRARYEDDDRDGWRTLFGAAAIPTLGFTWERA